MKQDKIWEYFQQAEHSVKPQNAKCTRTIALTDLVDPGSTVLNIGIGQGFIERRLVKKGVDVYSLDPDKGAVQRLEEATGQSGRAHVGYAQEMPFENGMFDVVVMGEVLEHLDDEVLHGSLKEILRVLRPGGMFVGSVPDSEDLAKEMVVCPDCGKVFHRAGHVRSFSSESLQQVLRDSGLHVESTISRYYPIWNMLNWKGKITTAIKIALGWLGTKGEGFTILFVARKPG